MGLPGGGPEEGESIEQSIARELFEETGLQLKSFQTVGLSSNPAVETVTYPNGDRVQNYILIVYVTEWIGTLACLDGESLALEFFDVKNLPNLMPHDRTTLEIFHEYERSGKFQLF